MLTPESVSKAILEFLTDSFQMIIQYKKPALLMELAGFIFYNTFYYFN